MKELLLSYATYNLWSNGQLLNAMLVLPDEGLKAVTGSSFGSLYQTALHAWSAESVWWQRVRLQERINWPIETFTGSMNELAVNWQATSRQWQEWIAGASEPMLQHVYHYQNSKKEVFKQPTWQTLLHVFNHNTYHRGQLVDLLRVQGVTKIPATDYVVWSRKGR